jgi:hypothetical protein
MKEENKNISEDSLKTLLGSNTHRHEHHAAFVDKINLRDHYTEKLETSDVRKCYGKSEIGRGSFLGRRDMSKDEASFSSIGRVALEHRHYF